ncbi:FKBP-type peptidyl-prolyl cis-trans isomerase [Desulfocapsa sulfexigens DSM 10523]|uniref:Peptidyl-prolyl cis-trans isomerase n=1 Tax=Desulfocapsa sulfexigens (strain DSM 10523 / SB164P1) TaxID=1167006 RepID=M1PIZ4_DESSD|nr:FKBP-type peptidyl-prolyl cis-trans isomerase [Desulfocapsa sulfexigens]AGF79540.1 FKBP-type peptidyl-prolyl cis-trans isomerase [Desulfocapsa sulfexigens DSM 10523]
MKQVQKNDSVTVTLVGTLDNGTVFESVEKSAPLVLTLGVEGVPKPIQRTLVGMQVGEMRRVRLDAEEGEFGIRRSDLLQEIPKNQFSKTIEPKVGLVLSMNVDSGGVTHQVPATIVELKENSIMIDYNHPLAGHPLNYEITVIEINGES